jgi:aerobic carbon-monoxide dehydrogenase small subunit
MKSQVELEVNGEKKSARTDSGTLLAELLHDELGLTGTHIGCETSNCGACTVLMDGRAVKSCAVLAVQAAGRKVTTIEGIGSVEGLDPIQYAFWQKHGLQCGFCTPGMIMAAYELLERNPDPDEDEIREGLSGNLCRCTGYVKIVESVKYASKLRKKGKTRFRAQQRRKGEGPASGPVPEGM